MSHVMGRPVWNLLTGTAAKYAFLLVNIVIGIFLMPFTMHHLGKAEYGLWMLVASMTAYFQLLDLGYGNGLVRQVTQADARGDEDGVNTVLSTFVVVYSGLGLIALIGVAGLIAFVVPRFPHLSSEQVTNARWVLGILGLRIAVGFPMSVFGAINTARQRFALTGSIAIVVTLLQAIATYLVLTAGYGLVPLVAATTSLALLSYIAYAIAARRTFPGMHLALSRFSRREVREVTAFSAYVFLISIAIQLGYNLDNVVIAAFAGTSAVAVYAVAFRIADYQRQLCNQFNGLLFPIVVRFQAAGQGDALRATLIDGTRIALGLIGGVTLCVVTFAQPLVAAWMGPGFEDSLPALYALAIAGVILVGAGPLGNVLLARGRHKLVAYSCLGEALVNLGLSIVLVRRFGIVGAAIGTLVAVTISNVFVQMPAACRTIGLPVRSFLREVAMPMLLALVPAAVVAAWLHRGAGGLLDVLVRGAIVGAVYVVAFVALGLGRSERTRYFGSLRKLRAERVAVAGVVLLLFSAPKSASADPIGLQWPQPGGPGTPVAITYSYSNLLNGAFLLITPQQLRAATEEAFRLWAGYAPLHFIEQSDIGPRPSDQPYTVPHAPQIRIGHHTMTDWAHAYYPGTWDGLAGDIHLARGAPWNLSAHGQWNYLEVITHEIGHALGLGHEIRDMAMMNPFFPRRFSGLGSAFLFPADIADIRAVYGRGRGTVQPLAPVPEPATLMLTAAGAAALLRHRFRKRARS